MGEEKEGVRYRYAEITCVGGVSDEGEWTCGAEFMGGSDGWFPGVERAEGMSGCDAEEGAED
jgi:hypothetical protein